MATFSNKKTSKTSSEFFICELCDYKCCKKYNFDRHLSSVKHFKQQKSEQKEQNEQPEIYCCENCGKEYSDRTGLRRHKKKCLDNHFNLKNTIEKKTN